MKAISRLKRSGIHWTLAMVMALGLARTFPLYAQGCVVGRQCDEGVESSLMAGQSEVGLAYRGFEANKHWNGAQEQFQRQSLRNFVINHQNNWDLLYNYGVSSRISLGLDLPYSDSGWSLPIPTGPVPGPRSQQHAQGIGDLTFGSKLWLLDPMKHMDANVQIGLGITAPTGNDAAESVFPNLNGTNRVSKPVDQSIQPGSGSWGLDMNAQGYKTFNPITLFAQWSYLAEQKDTNGVPSIVTNLGLHPAANAPSTGVNSVPDQYLYRIGIAGGIPHVSGLSGSVAYRVEGVPQTNLFGGHHGFRRPGYTTSIEPGLTYTRANTTVALSVPLSLYHNRLPTISDGTSVAGDATFADRQLIVGITHRFGGE
ncbi:MAG: hypothetical protein LC772_00605 [Chloroflexi bacterium]|nr:hypothetical protein [Chloroflexota bacterium]